VPCQHKRDKPSLATSIGATGGVVSNSISTSLLAFIVGYAAILAVPGPNMLALGGLAALRGFRAAVPMSLGIAGGATTLAAIIDVTSATASRLPWRTVAEFAGAGLLLLVACLVMRLRPNAPAERSCAHRSWNSAPGFAPL
jgi:threonine/homoserine/homoserine lactone efflux protein